jgi:hypothetical protein
MTTAVRTSILGFCFLFWPSGLPAGEKEADLKGLDEKEVQGAVKKSSSFLAKIREGSLVIQKAGFEVSQVAVDVGLRPAVHVDLVRKTKISDAAMKALLEENKKNKTLVAVLKALQTGNKLNVSGYSLRQVTIVATILPKTTFVLAPVDG